MKHSPLPDAPPADLPIDTLLKQHYQNPGDCPPPRVLERAGEGALHALDLLHLEDQRPLLKDTVGSLSQHITALAAAARISIKEIAGILRLPPDAESSTAAARAWAWLASTLGIGPEEVDLRLRWGFAFNPSGPRLQRSMGRQQPSLSSVHADHTATPEARLQDEELTYALEQRRDLAALRAAARSVFKEEAM